MPGIYLVAGAGAIFLIWLIFLPGGHFLTNLLTFMYIPASHLATLQSYPLSFE